ncbi:MAG: hypothetical protein ACF8R7_01355 [Phycisphaerales bacterium JB039]
MSIVRTWLSIVVVGCSTAIVCAQAEVRLESEKSELAPGESTVVRMYAAFPPAEFAFAGIVTDLLSSTGSSGWSDFGIPAALRAPGSSDGTPTAMGIEQIIAGQIYFPPAGPWPDLSNPMLFWEGTYTAPRDVSVPFDLSLATQTTRFDTYFSMHEFGTRSHIVGLIEGEGTIRVVPAPASLALVVMGGATVSRRRR